MKIDRGTVSGRSPLAPVPSMPELRATYTPGEEPLASDDGTTTEDVTPGPLGTPLGTTESVVDP